MNKYEKGKIYKLTNTQDNKVYVGGTIRKLCQRLSSHKNSSKKYPNRKVYNHLNTIGWKNVKIELIEAYPCESKKDLCKREKYWKNRLNALLNKNTPHVENYANYFKNRYQNRTPEQKARYNVVMNKKVTCRCGLKLMKRNLKRHLKNKNHVKY